VTTTTLLGNASAPTSGILLDGSYGYTARGNSAGGTPVFETMARVYATANQSGSPTSGTLYMQALTIPAGFVIGHLAFVSGTQAAVTPTHWWFGLYDLNRVQLATTADQTTGAWAANTEKSLAVATIASGASSTFTTTYSGFYYIGFMMTATTVPTLYGTNCGTTLIALAPITSGTSDTGATTPPAFPHTAGAITANVTNQRYAYVTT
jgi:hypothetical protein